MAATEQKVAAADDVKSGEARKDSGEDASDSNAQTESTAASGTASARDENLVKPGRVVSLDVFRGMTIAGMILVNNSGGPSYGPLDHAEWNGWTHTDLIFPFFMFIAGASMVLSFSARSRRGYQPSAVSSQQDERQEQSQPQGPSSSKSGTPQDDGGLGNSRTKLILHTVRRGAIIFLIGLALNLFPWFFDANRYANLRIPGVLQRIGFCYIFAGIIYLYTSCQLSAVSSQSDQKQKQEQDRWWQRGAYVRAGIVATLLLGYWAAMKLVPVPGFGAGDLAPTHNLAAYIDNAIFTTKHMWQHRAWDPEGLLSSVPALCTMLLGTFVGELFSRQPSAISRQQDQSQDQVQISRSARNDNSSTFTQSTWQYKVKQLLLWGVAAVVVGEVWNVWFPINKNLWTSSYVIFTAGYAMLALAAVYWVVDVRGWRRWATPFLVFGTNAILAFTLSTWVTKMLLITRVPNGEGGSMSAWSWIIVNSWRPHFADVRNSSLAFALSYVLIWLAVMWWFYRKRIFLKV